MSGLTIRSVATPADGAEVESAECGRRPRVLFLTHRVPYPPDKGDRIRSYNLLRYLAGRADVWLGSVADEPWTAETEQVIRSLTVDSCLSPVGVARKIYGGFSLLSGRSLTEGWFYSRNLGDWVDQLVANQRIDVVVSFCSGMLCYADRPALRELPLIVDLVDVDSEKWLQYARGSTGPKSWLYRLEGVRLRKVEQQLAERAKAVTLVSREEADLYRQIAPAAKTFAVGNGVDYSYFRRPAEHARQPQTAVFLGALDYLPNVEGIRWFCAEVWPTVRSRYPAAELRIVGRRPTPAVEELANLPGVAVHADVPDVRPYLFDATVAIAPLVVARGVQNKVLEAMACETPVIATPAALEGISAVTGRDALSADSVTGWCDRMAEVFDDAALCERLTRAGREHVENSFEWNARLAPFGQLLEQIVTANGRSA